MKNSTKYYLSLLALTMLFSCAEKESVEPKEGISEEEFVPPVTAHELIQGAWDLVEISTFTVVGVFPVPRGEVIFSFSSDSLYVYNTGERNILQNKTQYLYEVGAKCRNEADSLCEIKDQFKWILFDDKDDVKDVILDLDSSQLVFGEGYRDGWDYYLQRRSFEEYVPVVSD